MFYELNQVREYGRYTRPKIKVFGDMSGDEVSLVVSRFINSQFIHPIAISAAIPVRGRGVDSNAPIMQHSITLIYQERTEQPVPIAEGVFPDDEESL